MLYTEARTSSAHVGGAARVTSVRPTDAALRYMDESDIELTDSVAVESLAPSGSRPNNLNQSLNPSPSHNHSQSAIISPLATSGSISAGGSGGGRGARKPNTHPLARDAAHNLSTQSTHSRTNAPPSRPPPPPPAAQVAAAPSDSAALVQSSGF